MKQTTKIIICLLAMQTLALIGGDVEELHNLRNCVLRVGRVGFSNNTTAIDTSGHGNDGTCVGGCVWNKAVNAYSFNGSSTYINLNNSLDEFSFIQNTLDFTISAWIKINNLDGRLGIMGSAASSGDKGFFFLWETSGGGNGDHALRVFAGRGTGICEVDGHSDNNSTITDNNWHHVVVKGNPTYNGFLFYVDNVLKTTTYRIPFAGYSSGDSTRALLLGAVHHTSPILYYNGTIANVHIYDRTLSATEIHKLYLKGKELHK